MTALFFTAALVLGLFTLFFFGLVIAGGASDDRYTLWLVLLMFGTLAAQYCLN